MCVWLDVEAHLGLDEDVLDWLEVGEVEKSPQEFAQEEVLSGAARETEYTLEAKDGSKLNFITVLHILCTATSTYLVLPSHRNQVLHWRVGTPLGDCPQKLASLRSKMCQNRGRY